MAIIPDVPHVSVDIVVDGRPLPEYLDKDDADSISSDSTTKYVECVSGSSFGIRSDLTGMELRHLQRGHAISVGFYLDGEKVGSSIRQFPLRHHAVCTRSAMHYKENGVWKERKFMFSDLVTSEEVARSGPNPKFEELGTITVKLQYAMVKGTTQSPRGHRTNLDQETIHEKDLKGRAISHRVKLGDATTIRDHKTTEIRWLGDPFAVFHFRYRSRRDLQALCLIPRSPSPVPLEDRPEESLTREDLLELLRRQKARQEKKIEIRKEMKREPVEDDDSDDDLVVISSRPPAKQRKISTDVDEIDLTGD